MNVNLISFGFKNGIPIEAAIVFDARGITNPHNDRSLRQLSGTDGPVQEQVLMHPIAHRILTEAKRNVNEMQEDQVLYLLPAQM